MVRHFIDWKSIHPLLRSCWAGSDLASAAIWQSGVQSLLTDVTRGVRLAWRGTLPHLDAAELASEVSLCLLERAARNRGLATPCDTASGNAAPWLAEVFRNAALDEVEAGLREAGLPCRRTRKLLLDVTTAAKAASAGVGRPARHAEVARELQMPIQAYWKMLARHGIRSDGAWGYSLAANGPIELDEIACGATQERALLEKDEAQALETAVRAGRLRPTHRLVWFCLQLPEALDDALVRAAAEDAVDGRGLARDVEDTLPLLDRWLAIQNHGADDRTCRLTLAWILRSSEPLVDDDLVACAERWLARDRSAADRARDVLRVWVARARTALSAPQDRAA
jgi:hypothetical protein